MSEANPPATNVVPFKPPGVPERFPPASIETEQGLLGLVLMDRTGAAFHRVTPILRAEFFFERAHQEIWAALEQIAARGEVPWQRSLRAYLGANAEFDVGGGVTVGQYLARLLADVSSLDGLADARMIRDYWMLRQIEAFCASIGEGGYVASQKLEDLFTLIDGLRAQRQETEQHSATVGEVGIAIVSEIERTMRGEDPPVPATGIVALDELVGGGLHPGTLVTLAARTAMGKSAIAIEFAGNVARKGFGVVYHSLEVSRRQVAARVVSSRLDRRGIRIPFTEIMRRKGLSPAQLESIAGEFHDMRQEPLRIEDGSGRTIQDIAASSERRMKAFEKRGVRPGLVVIDHAHIVRPSRHYQREDERFKEVADGALALAKHLSLPVLLLAQCNRQAEGRDDKRPSLADIRGAGAFEENSDAVLFLYRPAYYIEKSAAYRTKEANAIAEFEDAKNILEIIVDKNRMGPSNRVMRAYVDLAVNAVRNLQAV